MTKIHKEARMMNACKHPNIIQVYEVIFGPNHNMLVTEYLSGGDLLKYVKSNFALNENEAKGLFRSAVLATRVCHTRGIAHRDIKLDNLLLTTDLKSVKL